MSLWQVLAVVPDHATLQMNLQEHKSDLRRQSTSQFFHYILYNFES